ncbi:hypothetical protein ASPACDRAFT_55782 [Aspergillus aculeatus ATCC 16872]|uniref:Uncharacterized protein n=1 Tax=Aspergillus aculeatus (strain ATCC 16872 / CBS 172.66 / WB 5094) TaxID=690307 RepID=A0A1L9X7I1_ASPA1|nr:uncharacterized protein ASPACDRAFT_55782 [Aspergillus aculeatus ATCC 16872]OJK04284.1 hypothetical protein ASPACDRAFT_55782 [Aspergillus aculeatus ATCC 16872]
MNKEMDFIEIGGVPVRQAQSVNPPAEKPPTHQDNDGEDDDDDDTPAAWVLQVETDPVTNRPSYYYLLSNPDKADQNVAILTKDSCFKPGIFTHNIKQPVPKDPELVEERKEPEKARRKASKKTNSEKDSGKFLQKPSNRTPTSPKVGPCFIQARCSLTVDMNPVTATASSRDALIEEVNAFDPSNYEWEEHSEFFTERWGEVADKTAVEGLENPPVKGFWMPTPELEQLPGTERYIRIKRDDIGLMRDTSGSNTTDTYDQIYISKRLVEEWMENQKVVGKFAMPTTANPLRFWVRNATGRPLYFVLSREDGANANLWKQRYARAISSPGGGHGRSLNVNIPVYIKPISGQYKTLVQDAVNYANQKMVTSKSATRKQEEGKAVLMTAEHEGLRYVQIGISPFGHYTTWITASDGAKWQEKRPAHPDNISADRIASLQSSVETKDGRAKKLKAARATNPSYTVTVSAQRIMAAKGVRDSGPDQGTVMGISAPTVAASCMSWENEDHIDASWPDSAPWMAEWLHRCAYSWGAYGRVPADSQSPQNLIFGTYECNSLMTRYEHAWQKLVIMLETSITQPTHHTQLKNQIFWNAEDDKEVQWPSQWQGARWLCRRLEYTLKLNIPNPDLPPSITVNFYPLRRSFFTRVEAKIDTYIMGWIGEKLKVEVKDSKWITVIPTLPQEVKKTPLKEPGPQPTKFATADGTAIGTMGHSLFDQPSLGQSLQDVDEAEGLHVAQGQNFLTAKQASLPQSTMSIGRAKECVTAPGNGATVAHRKVSPPRPTVLTMDEFIFKETTNLFGRISVDVYALESDTMSYLAIRVPHLNNFLGLIPSLAGSSFEAIQLEDTTLSYRAVKNQSPSVTAELAVTTTVLMAGVLSPINTFLRDVLHQNRPRLVVSGMLSSHPDCLRQVPEPLGLKLRAELPDVSVCLFNVLTITHLGIDLMGTRRSAQGDYDFSYGFFGVGCVSSDVNVSWYIHKYHDLYNITILVESSWEVLPNLSLESVELGASWEGTDLSSVSLSLTGSFGLREGTVVLAGRYSRDDVELCGTLQDCSLDTLQQLCEDVFHTAIQTQTTHEVYFSDMSLVVSTKEGFSMTGTVTVDGHLSSVALIHLGPKGVRITGAIDNLDIPDMPTIHSASLDLSITQRDFKVRFTGMVTVQEQQHFTVSVLLARSPRGLEYTVHGGFKGSFYLRNAIPRVEGTFLDVQLTQLAICASNIDSPELRIPDLPYQIKKGFQIYGQTRMHTELLRLPAAITVCAAYGATDWLITGSYAGRVSLLETVSGLSTALKECGLTTISKAIDISVWELTISLARNQKTNAASVFFTADTDWLIFKHIRLAASTNSFTLGLVCQDDILSLTPLKDSLAPYLKLTNTQAVVFLGAIDPAAFPPLQSLASPHLAQRRNGFAVSSTIRLDTSALRLIKDLLQVEELTVAGMMSDTEFMLAVGLKAVHLFHDSIIMNGSFVVESRPGAGLFIGFQAHFSLFFPSVSKSAVRVEAAMGLNLDNYGMQLRLAVPSTLPDLFGIEGLEMASIAVEATFNPAQGPVPTQIGFSGAFRLASVNDLRSSANIRFSEGNPANSYLKGSIDRLNVPQLMHAFARGISRPAVVDSLVSNDGLDLRRIAVEIVPRDMVGVDGSPLKQRIYFEADMSLNVSEHAIWSAYAFIDISPSSFYILALMSPVILCPDVPALFRITRNNIGYSEKAANPVIPTPTQGHIDPAMLTDGPIMVIATDSQIDPPAFISGDLEVFGIRRAIYTRVDRDGFTVHLNQQTAPGPVGYRFNLRAECAFNSSLTLDLHIDLNVFPTPVSAVIHDQLIDVHLGQGQIHLNLATSWTPQDPYFAGDLEATARVLGVEVKLHPFRVRLSAHELSSLEEIARFVVYQFQRRGLALFQEALGNKTLEAVMNFVREVFGKLVADDSVFIRAVTQIAGRFNESQVMKALLNVRRGTREDAIAMVKQLGLPESEAALLLGQVLSTAEDLAQNVLVALLRD